MAAIRRQAMSPAIQQPKTAQPSTHISHTQAVQHGETVPSRAASSETLAKNREALSLAAAAIKDKGAEISLEKIEAYTEAIDPDWQKRNSGDNSQRQQHKEQKKEAGEDETPDKAPLSATDIKNMALESTEKDPMLSILNRLPGRNGQFWLVLPFDFNESGKEFKVSLRILIDKEIKHMALDIAEYGEQQRRWLFVPVHQNQETLNATDSSAISRLMLYIQPELPPKAIASLAHKMSQAMEIPLENISVKNMIEQFPCEADERSDPMFTINEAV
jgi:hypothetical protein